VCQGVSGVKLGCQVTGCQVSGVVSSNRVSVSRGIKHQASIGCRVSGVVIITAVINTLSPP